MTLTNLHQVQKNMTLRGDKGFYTVSSVERKLKNIVVINCQTNEIQRVKFAAIRGMEIVKY